ncbi:hypothetical protein P9112_004534 [Eukaryota sp. TZLM1-RC]
MNCKICNQVISPNENRYLHVKRCGEQRGLSIAQIVSAWRNSTSVDTPQPDRTSPDQVISLDSPEPQNTFHSHSSPMVSVQIKSPIRTRSRSNAVNRRLIPPRTSNQLPNNQSRQPSTSSMPIPRADDQNQTTVENVATFCPKCGGGFNSSHSASLTQLGSIYSEKKEQLTRDYNDAMKKLQDDHASALHDLHRSREPPRNSSSGGMIAVEVRSPTRSRRERALSPPQPRANRNPSAVVPLGEGRVRKRKKAVPVSQNTEKVNLTTAEEEFLINEIRTNEKLVNLWVSMLVFETISVDHLQACLAEVSLSYSKSLLMNFLDKHGIVFKLEHRD